MLHLLFLLPEQIIRSLERNKLKYIKVTKCCCERVDFVTPYFSWSTSQRSFADLLLGTVLLYFVPSFHIHAPMFSLHPLYLAVVDLEGGLGKRRAPTLWPKFLHMHAVFGRNWPSNRLGPPGVGAPLWKILDSPLPCPSIAHGM